VNFVLFSLITQERFVIGGCATPHMKQLNDTERLGLGLGLT